MDRFVNCLVVLIALLAISGHLDKLSVVGPIAGLAAVIFFLIIGLNFLRNGSERYSGAPDRDTSSWTSWTSTVQKEVSNQPHDPGPGQSSEYGD